MAVEPIRRVRPVAEHMATLNRNVERMNSAVLNNLADVAISMSPVDTGTYITSHAIYEGDNLGSIAKIYSSIGKPGGQDRGGFESTGRAKLTAMIEVLDHSTGNYIFGNESEHRREVEVDLRYGVFRATREAFPEAAAAALAQLPHMQRGYRS